MRCPLEFGQSAELIVGYGARTLDPDAAAAFERHIDSCVACREAAAAQRAVWAALDEWSEQPISPDFNRRLYERIEKTEHRDWWIRRVLAPAAACLTIAAIIWFKQPDRTVVPPAKPAPQIEQVEHALDDMDLLDRLGEAIAPASQPSSTEI